MPTARECECGSGEVTQAASGCSRCRFLDGYRPTQMKIISSLRADGPMTLAQLEAATGMKRNNLSNSIRNLERVGRLRRRSIEGDTSDRETLVALVMP